MEIMRAEAEWQRAGAYSVRIEGMNRQHHISLREEFDEHDCEGTKYIVLLDDGYPVATCRFYEPKQSARGKARCFGNGLPFRLDRKATISCEMPSGQMTEQ